VGHGPHGGSGSFKAKGGSGQKSMPPGQEKKWGSGEWMPPGLAKKSGKGGDWWDGKGGSGEKKFGGSGEYQAFNGGTDGSRGSFLGFLGNLWNGLFNRDRDGMQTQGVSAPRQGEYVDPSTLNLNGPGSPAGDAYTSPTQAPVNLGLPSKADAGAVPFVDQYNPIGKDAAYTNGIANCGPAVMAMIAKAAGQDGGLTDAQLINRLGEIGGTTAKGTSGNGMIAIAESLGKNTAAREGADLNWINQELASGHRVIANGDFYSVPGRVDPALASGHYLMITGYENGKYNVVDPADGNVRQMDANQMQAYILNQPEGGFAISVW
jgi:hypothetical protein